SSAGTYGCPQAYVKGDTLYRWLKNVPIFAASFGLIVIILGPLGLTNLLHSIGPAALFNSMLFLIGGIKVTDDEYGRIHNNAIASYDYPPIPLKDRFSLHEVKHLERWLLEVFRKTDPQAELKPLKFGRFAIIYKLLLGGEDFALSFPMSIEESHVAAVAHDARHFKRCWESGRRRFISRPNCERTFGLGITKGDKWMSLPIVVSEFLHQHEELNFARGVLRRWESDRKAGISRFIPLPKEDIPHALAEMIAAIVYHYELDKDDGTTVASVFVNSGDFVLKRNSKDPPRIRITTIRQTRSGVDTSAFIKSLIQLYTAEPIILDGMMTRPAAFVKPRCAQVPVCISNPSVAFYGLVRGLRYLAEDLRKDPKEGERMAEEWIRQFAESQNGKPYRPQAERFLKGDLPLEFGNDPLEGQPSLNILQSAIDELYEKRREATFRDSDEVRSYDQAIQLAEERMAELKSSQDKNQGPSMTSEPGDISLGVYVLADPLSPILLLAGFLGLGLLGVIGNGSGDKNDPDAQFGGKVIQSTREKYGRSTFIRELMNRMIFQKNLKVYPRDVAEMAVRDFEKTINRKDGLPVGSREPRTGFGRFITPEDLRYLSRRIYAILPFLFDDGLTYGYYENPLTFEDLIAQRKEGLYRIRGFPLAAYLTEAAHEIPSRVYAEITYMDVPMEIFIYHFLVNLTARFDIDIHSSQAPKDVISCFQHGFYHEIGHVVFRLLSPGLKRRFKSLYAREGYISSQRERG
ncbi:MAG: hypothetical protein ABIJ41_06110, partial [Candidatus Omnitrophota bacterium]